MSVLIKGMEMPGSCYYCPFADGSWGYSPPHKKRCLISGKDMPVDERYVQKNQPVCPLVPVPPHGRLIDADKLDYSNTDLLGNHIVYMVDIEDAPTIIPASTAEEKVDNEIPAADVAPVRHGRKMDGEA